MLSIIVPTLNEERMLASTLLGIRKLTSVPFELIVADSGSTDRTLKIAAQYADKVVTYNDLPRNAARGRNLGASVASGEFLVFIDADIRVDNINGFFQNALRAFKQTSLVCIVPNVKVLSEVRTLSDRIGYLIYLITTYIGTNLLNWALGSGELLMVRRRAFETVGGLNESLQLAEDIDLCGRLRKMGKVRMLPKLLVMNDGRRPREIGWIMLWYEWIINAISVRCLGRPWRKDWIPIR